MLELRSDHIGLRYWHARTVRWWLPNTRTVIVMKGGNLVAAVELPEDRVHHTTIRVDGMEAKVYGGSDRGRMLALQPCREHYLPGLWGAITTCPPLHNDMRGIATTMT